MGLCVCVHICLSVRLSASLPAYLPAHPSVRLSVCLSVCYVVMQNTRQRRHSDLIIRRVLIGGFSDKRKSRGASGSTVIGLINDVVCG